MLPLRTFFETMKILLCGQLCSGKNAMRTTRQGRHYAAPRFKTWRTDAMLQLRAQHLIHRPMIETPVQLKVSYWPGDCRTRDISGMLDALFHLLVYSKMLKDDGLVRDVTWYWQGIDRKCPRTVMELEVVG